MPSVLDDFEALKRRVADAARKRDMAAGELAAAEARLRDEFGCKDVAAAKHLLEKLGDAERQKVVDYTAARAAFDAKWAESLRTA